MVTGRAAFEVDRILGQVAERDPRVRFLPYIGRPMTVTRRNGRSNRHVVYGTRCESYFSDRFGVHLSVTGYRRMMDKLGDVLFSRDPNRGLEQRSFGRIWTSVLPQMFFIADSTAGGI